MAQKITHKFVVDKIAAKLISSSVNVKEFQQGYLVLMLIKTDPDNESSADILGAPAGHAGGFALVIGTGDNH